MIKKIIILSVIGLVALSASLIFSDFNGEKTPEPEPKSESNIDPTSNSIEESFDTESSITADVVMPTKVSRPGCDKEDRCYIPSVITIESGNQVTWINEDSAFHSVTSGFYGDQSELFDSGHLDPFETYTLDFDEIGTYDYFCTLHPWMKGQVIVE